VQLDPGDRGVGEPALVSVTAASGPFRRAFSRIGVATTAPVSRQPTTIPATASPRRRPPLRRDWTSAAIDSTMPGVPYDVGPPYGAGVPYDGSAYGAGAAAV
jgi:hypothetical protein